ncbi:hypothetical protein BCR44DRAFT_1433911 [Catenaria anguillulae PL171]|uniref:Secreted protein n=1 Tax=Catenaria anguillulae PL171 TaxID=765915 RepID=A0A1Y2HM44_9FUNG|nr:hypothetical protein BCR44DRAFT_1433911 [Catenaria anguillulae PL171]
MDFGPLCLLPFLSLLRWSSFFFHSNILALCFPLSRHFAPTHVGSSPVLASVVIPPLPSSPLRVQFIPLTYSHPHVANPPVSR